MSVAHNEGVGKGKKRRLKFIWAEMKRKKGGPEDRHYCEPQQPGKIKRGRTRRKKKKRGVRPIKQNF